MKAAYAPAFRADRRRAVDSRLRREEQVNAFRPET
jgi:hypothetical protein